MVSLKLFFNFSFNCQVGSWSTDKEDKQSNFIQTALDLNKLVDFDTDSFAKTLPNGLENQEQALALGSTISNLYKRKRTSEEEIANNTNGKNKIEEPSPRKLETINKLKQQQQSSANKKSDYFMLSYLVN